MRKYPTAKELALKHQVSERQIFRWRRDGDPRGRGEPIDEPGSVDLSEERAGFLNLCWALGAMEQVIELLAKTVRTKGEYTNPKCWPATMRLLEEKLCPLYMEFRSHLEAPHLSEPGNPFKGYGLKETEAYISDKKDSYRRRVSGEITDDDIVIDESKVIR